MLVRLYVGPDGKSHFQDLPVPVTVLGSDPFPPKAASNVIFRTVDDNWSRDWHAAPRRM